MLGRIFINASAHFSNLFRTHSRQIFTHSVYKPIAQGIHGNARLITGNFSYFTKNEACAIQSSLNRGKAFVLIYDRDFISVPANERAMWIREHFNHHPNLEVRIAYGPPDEKASSEQYAAYIKKQIPEQTNVTAVCCNHFYSKLLAKEFSVPHNSSKKLKGIKSLEDAIKKNPDQYQHLFLPAIKARLISPFKTIIDPALFQKWIDAEKEKVLVDIPKLNPNHPNKKKFFKRTPWNTASLAQINLPIVIGNIDTLEKRQTFSHRTNPQVFDMPIYMPGQGWKIPTELIPYQHVFAKIVAAESLSNPSIADCNTYVTVDCGIVFPSGYARREGLHVDGFLTKANARAGKDGIVWGDNTYIVSDSRELQTELYPGPFDLSQVNQDDPKAVLQAFTAQGKNMAYHQGNPYDILRLTTNTVHAVHPNLTDQSILRSFVKVTFSERLFNRGGNTINPNLNYRFTYVPRTKDRNTQNFIGIAPLGFIEVDLNEIDFAHSRFPHWVTPNPISVCKNPTVRIHAIPATEGEILETKIEGHTVTRNVAKMGDMKISRSMKTNEDSYFLGANFYSLYRKTNQKNIYAPKPRTLTAVKVNRNITFPASWGTRQNIPAGGFIVKDSNNDIWGIHQQSFNATYQPLHSSVKK